MKREVKSKKKPSKKSIAQLMEAIPLVQTSSITTTHSTIPGTSSNTLAASTTESTAPITANRSNHFCTSSSSSDEDGTASSNRVKRKHNNRYFHSSSSSRLSNLLRRCLKFNICCKTNNDYNLIEQFDANQFDHHHHQQQQLRRHSKNCCYCFSCCSQLSNKFFSMCFK